MFIDQMRKSMSFCGVRNVLQCIRVACSETNILYESKREYVCERSAFSTDAFIVILTGFGTHFI